MPHDRARGDRNGHRAAAARAGLLGLALLLTSLAVPTASAVALQPCESSLGVIEATCDLFRDGSDDFRDWLNGLSREARELLSNPLGFVSALIGSIITQAFELAARGLTGLANTAAGAISGGISALGARLTAVTDGLRAAGASVGDSILALFTTVWTAAASMFEPFGLLAPVLATLTVGGLAVAVVSALAWGVTTAKSAATAYFTGGALK